MSVAPLINARLKKFRDDFAISGSDNEAFEHFANLAVISSHHPQAIHADQDLLGSCHVGGPNDLGIDGIAVSVNGRFIKSTQDLLDLAAISARLSVNFIFVQSKYKPQFDRTEASKFADGLRDFFDDDRTSPVNDAVAAYIAIRQLVFSQDILLKLDETPTTHIYYITTSEGQPSTQVQGVFNRLQTDLKRNFHASSVNIQYVTARKLHQMFASQENKFEIQLDIIDDLALPAYSRVENSSVLLCSASEILRLVRTEDGVLRRALFNDNVRDFQGMNSIKKEILETLQNEPEKFSLLNNGITIVCRNFRINDRRAFLQDPQIVNGCQTSSLIYTASNVGIDLSDAAVLTKVISTDEEDITNEIVRGANRQNIVLDEAFEATRRFHKELEEFFFLASDKWRRVLYERRARQFLFDPDINRLEKVNLGSLTRYSVGILFDRPDLSHRHENFLLNEYGSKMFLDTHSKLPYYLACALGLEIESHLRDGIVPKALLPFRSHLGMIMREFLQGRRPDLAQIPAIDSYCEKILSYLFDCGRFRANLLDAVEFFGECRREWIDALGRSPDGLRDVQDFTRLILRRIHGNVGGTDGLSPIFDEGTVVDSDEVMIGKVVKIFRDRNLNLAGFVRCGDVDYFIHSTASPDFDFEGISGNRLRFRPGEVRDDGRRRPAEILDRVYD